MSVLIKKLLMLLIAVLIMLPASLVQSQDKEGTEAELVLLHYLDALSLGDTQTLSALMGGALLEKRTRLLNNPAYPQYLAETFGRTIFRIDRIAVVSPGVVNIDLTMKFGEDDIIQRRYILHRESSSSIDNDTYLVHDEIEPP